MIPNNGPSASTNNDTRNDVIRLVDLTEQLWEDGSMAVLCGPLPATSVHLVKGKGKGLETCYSAIYMSQTRDLQRFTISEVAADWHEPMVPQHIMWPSIARANGQWDQRCS